MKTFRFTAQRYIEAESEEEAIERFADNSFDFAASAVQNGVEEVDPRTGEPFKDRA